MRYRPLPVETQLAEVRDTQGVDAMVRVRSELFLQWARMPGFQFLTAVLRERERALDQALMVAADPMQAMRFVGARKEIDAIRSALSALVPAEQRQPVEWFDVAEEDYLGPIEQGT